MKKFISSGAQQTIETGVQLISPLQKVSGLNEKCGAVRNISMAGAGSLCNGGKIFYDNGHGILKSFDIGSEESGYLAPDLGNFPNLVSVSIPYPMSNRLFIHQWPQSLESIEIGQGGKEQTALNLAPLCNLSRLRSVALRMKGVRLAELLPLAEKLEVLAFGDAADMENISQFSNLHTLNYGRHTGSMKHVGALKNLKSLSVETLNASTLEGLEGCKSLERLRIQGGSLEDIDALAGLDKLRTVDTPCLNLKSIDALAGHNLEVLLLSGSSVLDFSPLAEMTELRVLGLDFTYFKDMELLSKLKKLERLSIPCTWGDDLTPLAGLENLEHLNIWDCREIKDLSPLYGLKKLKAVYVDWTQHKKFEDDRSVPKWLRDILTERNTF